MIHIATRQDQNTELYVSWYRESDGLGNGLPLSKFLKRTPVTLSSGAIPLSEFLTPAWDYHEFAAVPEDYDVYNAYEDYPEAFV